MAEDRYSITLVIDGKNNASASIRSVNSDLNQLEQQVGKNTEGSKRLQGALGDVGQAFKGFLTGLALREVVSLGQEMYELGSQVRIVSGTFDELAGGAENANFLLSELRTATGGIITDFGLMQGANKYLAMGLGDTTEEISGLIEMAVKLGGAMGNNPTQSIEDFSLLLANESILRLDTFGISSARVKERIDELLASGEALDRSQAFRMAVMEVGANSMERLGDAATAAETPIARLQTRLENLWNAASQNVAIGVDTFAALAEGAITYSQAAQAEIAGVHAAIQELYGVSDLDIMLRGDGSVSPAQLAQAQAYYRLQQDNARIAAEMAATQARITAEITTQAARQVEITQYQQENAGLANETMSTIGFYEREISRLRNSHRNEINGAELFTPEELDHIVMMRDYLTSMTEQVHEFVEAGLVPQGAEAFLQQFVALSAELADNAERGAAAYRNMTLPQSLGEGATSNPLGTGLTAQALSYFQASGLDDESYTRLEDALRLASGEYTDATLAMRDGVMPLLERIYDEKGIDAVAEAIGNLEEFLRQANLEGWTPEQIAGMLQSGTPTGWAVTGGTGSGGQQIVVNPGDTPGGVAARYGMTVQQILAATGAANPYSMQPGSYGAAGGGELMQIPEGTINFFGELPGQTAETTDALGEWDAKIDGALQTATELSGVMDAMSETELNVTVNVSLNDPTGAMAFITSGQPIPLGTTTSGSVRDNGGTVRGVDPRARTRTDQ